MPTFTWPVGAFNVQGSLNYAFQNNINTNLPGWVSASFPVIFNYPDEPLVFPCFSVTHLGGFDEPLSEGDLVDAGLRGQRVNAIAEVSAWQSAKDNYNWPRDLVVMRDMVKKLFGGTRTIVVADYYSSPSNPSNTNYVIRIERVDEVAFAPDPNPNVKRKRLLVHYYYVERQA